MAAVRRCAAICSLLASLLFLAMAIAHEDPDPAATRVGKVKNPMECVAGCASRLVGYAMEIMECAAECAGEVGGGAAECVAGCASRLVGYAMEIMECAAECAGEAGGGAADADKQTHAAAAAVVSGACRQRGLVG